MRNTLILDWKISLFGHELNCQIQNVGLYIGYCIKSHVQVGLKIKNFTAAEIMPWISQ